MSDILTLASQQPSVASTRPERRKRSLGGAWIGWLLPLVILVLWQLAGTPTPLDVWRAGAHLAGTGELFTNMWVSALRALAGLVVGGSIGLAFGFSNGLSRWSDALTDTSLQMARNVPHLAMIPLVLIWFGIGEGAKLFLVALGVFFPIYLNTLHGIRNVDPQLIEMGRSYGMNGRALFRRIIIPGALPSIFIGLRYSLGIAWLTLIVAETLSAESGIGHMTMEAREFNRIDIVIVGILIYALLGKGADSSVRLLERHLLSWNPAYSKGARP